MTVRRCKADLPLPRAWRDVTRTGVLHAISVAAMAMTSAWSKASAGRSSWQRALAEVDRLGTEVALLKEELELKDARLTRVPARRRPYYGPIQRMRILKLRAARGWSAKQVADRFILTEETIASWMKRLDEEGETGLVQLEEPVNKFRAVSTNIVRPDKASMFGRSQSCRERNQTPVAWMAAARETETVEAHRQSRSWNGERATGPQRK